MTCIVGLVDGDGSIWMGGDSATFIGQDVVIRPQGKVFTSGEFVMGVSGDSRMSDVLWYDFQPPVIEDRHAGLQPETTPDLKGYMVTKFVNAMRDCLKEAGYARQVDCQEKTQGVLLVGVRGRLFAVYSDYGVTEDCLPYRAIGAGEDYARGAMDCLMEGGGWQPERWIRRALWSAETHSTAVRGPYTVLHLPYHEKATA